ncbi:MAG: enoyl-CoA hydratase/isomerase family protein [Dehalococcoidia bacterium]|nr:enoyl-CoA hydratase/isomerase family protein [Dehalococcoidia bacterium]MYD28788.1 enoyl-CoA hydratase/isomerase family protein [Dehalococcoidia bacterium]
MSELVLREDHDGVATLSLNRPEALNSLNVPLFAELREHVAAIAAETDTVGCVVLRGEGRAFSAGNDLKALGTPAPEPYYQAETIDMIEALPQPVIASVRGACYTGALELMLAADLCIAGESAIFCDSHGEWALTPLWGLTQRLPRRIGPLLAREMMYTARRVDAHEAVRIGLANRVVPDAELDEATAGMAAQIAGNSWHTLRADKRLLNEGLNYSYAEGLAFERRTSPGAGPELAERLERFRSKS